MCSEGAWVEGVGGGGAAASEHLYHMELMGQHAGSWSLQQSPVSQQKGRREREGPGDEEDRRHG